MAPTVLDNLAASLRAYLTAQFATGSNEVLAFEAFGVPVDPDAFRATPQGAFNPVLVAEHLTKLADHVGQIVDGQFHRNWVASQLFGALLDATVQDASTTAAFGAIKGTAEETYRSAYPTFPIAATPDDWYDPSVVANWTQGRSVTSDGAHSVPIVVPEQWKLKVLAPEDRQVFTALRQPSAMLSLTSVDASPPPPPRAATPPLVHFQASCWGMR